MWTEITRAQYRRDELRYASDTRAEEWAQIAPLLPPPCRLGRPRGWDLRAILDAVLYLLWTGCQWRAPPPDLPPRPPPPGGVYPSGGGGTRGRVTTQKGGRGRPRAGGGVAARGRVVCR